MKLPLAAPLSWCLLLIPMAQQSPDNFLDLTKVKSPKNEKLVVRGGGGVSGSHDTRVPRLHLQITLLHLDKSTYQMGEETIYEITIRNVGKNAVVIPWSANRDSVKPDENYPPGYMDSNVGLVISDKVLGEQVIYGPWLYGSERVPSSLKKLRPGQMVKIRAPSRWALMSADASQRILSRLPQKYEVRARFTLSTQTFAPQPEPEISANSVIIKLKKRNR